MITITYEHISMFGTYDIPCTVSNQKNNEFFIKYFDQHIDENVTEWVDKSSLTFPSFGEMVM